MSSPAPETPAVLVCDAGGTRLKLGVARGGRLLARRVLDAEAERGLAAALERAAQAAGPLCREAGVEREELAGFGLSFPGIIEPVTERILSTPAGKFDDAKDLDVPGLAQRLFGLRARVCNDASAALAGEWRHGAARGCRSAVMMTLGTGIGTAAIIDGAPLRGQHGQAGCLGGHFIVNVDGRECRCGGAGCAESEASTWALPLLAREMPGFQTSALAGVEPLDYEAVFEEAALGDSVAEALRARAIRVWAAALVSLIHAYDPEIAVVGGGIMRQERVILDELRPYVAQHAWTPWGKVQVQAAVLKNDAGMLGVATLFDGVQR